MEQSIVTAMIVIGIIFSIFTVIMVTGEITTRRALGKAVPLSAEEAQAIIDAREERASKRYFARQEDAFREYVKTKQQGKVPSKDLIAKIEEDNQRLGLAA